ncbi:MAG: NrfD/PsrC family molybdoenzyme membrane anchor subunit [Acidobacteriota bacterium]
MSPTLSNTKNPRMSSLARNATLQRGLIAIGGLIFLAVVGVVGYTLINNTFIDLLLVFRDVAVIGYLFLLRIAVPIILILGIGAWLERKLNADAGRENRSLSERVPALKRIRLPHLSARGILAVTFIAALWAAFIGVTIARFFFGLSYATNMTDEYPWGIWLGFDMISGVALSAGGFLMAGAVYVFNIKRFHPIVRPAVLTAFLGYLLAIVGLLFDLGRWYNVWHAMFMWNLHSPLIEVAWCVILYTTVLALEFSPIVFERFHLNWPLKIMRRITIPLVIAGICLSTLHQSTLGTLFLVFPEKMNPLWYSPLLPVFFFISAIGVGLAMIIVESNLSARFLGQQLESQLLQSLGKAASIVLSLYLVLKAIDLVSRGATAYLFVPGFHSTLYWIEMFFGVLVPIVILATQRGRSNSRALFVTSGLIVGGVILNRLNTTLFSWWSYTSGGPVYIPTLAEIVGSVALVSIGVVAFGLIAKNFPVFTHEQHAQAPAE